MHVYILRQMYPYVYRLVRVCASALQVCTIHPQVMSYCRGVAARAVDPATRRKLFARLDVVEMACLRSFLDPPPTKGLTIKGSGKVAYKLHKRNHTREEVVLGSELHQQVTPDLACILLCFINT
jgi:hypothetical protein